MAHVDCGLAPERCHEHILAGVRDADISLKTPPYNATGTPRVGVAFISLFGCPLNRLLDSTCAVLQHERDILKDDIVTPIKQRQAPRRRSRRRGSVSGTRVSASTGSMNKTL